MKRNGARRREVNYRLSSYFSPFFTCTDSSGDDNESAANNRETVKRGDRVSKRDEKAKVKLLGEIYRWPCAAARREMKSVKKPFLPENSVFLLEITLTSQSSSFRINPRTTDYGFIYRSYCPSPASSGVPSVDLASDSLSFPSATYYPSPSFGLTNAFLSASVFESRAICQFLASRRYLKSMLTRRSRKLETRNATKICAKSAVKYAQAYIYIYMPFFERKEHKLHYSRRIISSVTKNRGAGGRKKTIEQFNCSTTQ